MLWWKRRKHQVAFIHNQILWPANLVERNSDLIHETWGQILTHLHVLRLLRWCEHQQETHYFLLSRAGREMSEIRSLMQTSGGSDKPCSPGYSTVLCLLSTKTPRWEAAVSEWDRSGAVGVSAVKSLEIQRIVWLTRRVTWTLKPPWRVDFGVWELKWWTVVGVCGCKGKP